MMTLANRMPGTARAAADARVLTCSDIDALDRVCDSGVVAAIWQPTSLPTWFAALTTAVGAGRYHVPRTILDNVDASSVDDWLAQKLPRDGIECVVRAALIDDVRTLIRLVGRWSGAERFAMRIFTASPDRRCGFHVDTVPAGVTPIGVLRVYNGGGTAYVEPHDVIGMDHFYRYLARREFVSRRLREAEVDDDATGVSSWSAELEAIDARPSFLLSPDSVLTADAGPVVAFHHLDASLHWSNHSRSLSWIHCSPMSGGPRLVVNVSPRGRARRAWRAASARSPAGLDRSS